MASGAASTSVATARCMSSMPVRNEPSLKKPWSTATSRQRPSAANSRLRRGRIADNVVTRPGRVSSETLVAQLTGRFVGLAEALEPHAPQHAGRLGELDLVVLDHLDAIAPGVAEAQTAAGQHLHAGGAQRLAHSRARVDH